MASSTKDDKKFVFPTKSIHGALIALVLSLAVFRFFIQGARLSLHHWEGNGAVRDAKRRTGDVGRAKEGDEGDTGHCGAGGRF